MLNEKLEQASKDASWRRIKFALGAVVIVGVAALVLVTVTLYTDLVDLRRATTGDGGEARTAAAPGPAPRVPPTAAPNRAPQAAPPATTSVRPAAAPPSGSAPLPQKPATEVARQGGARPPAPAPPDAAQSAELRENFKTALKEFEETLEPQILTRGFKNWGARTQGQLAALKDAAIASFGAGDYPQSLHRIEEATSLAKKSLQARQDAFDQAMTEARAAKEADDYEAASPHIEQALRLDPDSREAAKLGREIDGLPEILTLLRAAHAARAENDLEAESATLSKILKLDPTRQSVRQRAAVVARAIREDAFTRHIAEGLAHVDNRLLAEAEASLAAARRLYADRDETAVVEEKISALRTDLEFEAHVDAARAAQEADDWRRSLDLYARANTIRPNDQATLDGMEMAGLVTTLDEGIRRHLDAPHRLASKNVASLARQLITRARVLSGKSPSLDERRGALADVLSTYAVKVAVRVVSDGQTRISVRGVGRVGTTTEKLIQLTPGTYTFEGVRAGFKAKLVRVDIPPGAATVSVDIRCDERI